MERAHSSRTQPTETPLCPACKQAMSPLFRGAGERKVRIPHAFYCLDDAWLAHGSERPRFFPPLPA